MKKLLFMLLPLCSLAQENIQINISNNLKDPQHTVKSLTFLDGRNDQYVGSFDNGKNAYNYQLQQEPGKALEEKFDTNNKQKGQRDLVFYLQDLKVSSQDTGKRPIPAIHMKASMFEQKGGSYYYLNSMDEFVGQDVAEGLLGERLSSYVTAILTSFIKDSYDHRPMGKALQVSELPNYKNILASNLESYKTNQLKDGVYENFKDFFNQKPMEGATLEKDKQGKPKKLVKNDERIGLSNVYAYVEDGKAYLNTISGFKPLEKDENGFFINANRGELIRVASNNNLGMFGLVGGIASAIDQNTRQNKAKQQDKGTVYIDALNGEFIFSK